MVIDRDKQSWSAHEISRIATLCYQKKYGFVLNNPCFEIWPLLHLVDVANYSEDLREELEKNKKVNKSRNRIEKEIIGICGSYNKNNPDFEKFIPKTDDAISNSKKLSSGETGRWPRQLGTFMHKLIEKLKSR